MKINSSIEQAVYVLLMLAAQKGHTPVKSNVLSANLGVSDSYLKKILMRLARDGLVVASPSRNGGYRLARPLDRISLKDVFVAVDQGTAPIAFKGLARQAFSQAHVVEGERKVSDVIGAALGHFYDDLGKFKLSELLKEQTYREGAIDWEALAAEAERRAAPAE